MTRARSGSDSDGTKCESGYAATPSTCRRTDEAESLGASASPHSDTRRSVSDSSSDVECECSERSEARGERPS